MADITAAAADDAEIGDLEAELKMKREVRDDKYIALNENRSKVGLGVAGSAAYGNDSPLYGAGGLRPQIRPRLRPYKKAEGVTLRFGLLSSPEDGLTE